MLYRAKLNYGIVIYVIGKLILKVNQNKTNLNLLNTKKNKGSLLKNMKFLNQILVKWIIYPMILWKIVEIKNFIPLNTDVFMIEDLQIWKILKKLFYQLHSSIWKRNLNFMDYVIKVKMQKIVVFYLII